VYILASNRRVMYVGVTADLEQRLVQHRDHPSGFTARYRVWSLVDAEAFNEISDAIQRQKQLKGWRRSRKIALIEWTNPKWRDISDEDH
jgi:putative endonuclease